MKIWNQAPLVRLLPPFIAGILAAVYLHCRLEILVITSGLLLLFIASVVLPFYKISYRNSWAFGLAVNLLLFLFAWQLTICKTERLAADHFSKFISGKMLVKGMIRQSPVEKKGSFKMIVDIHAVEMASGWISTSGKAMLYVKKDVNAAELKYGDEVVLRCSFREIPPVQNPAEFDYRRFLAFHNIYQQASVDERSWKKTGLNSGNPILFYSYTLRDQLLDILKRENIQGDEFAVGAALMLGYSDKLDADILSAYSGTGALHVLSVSGLHVAIVYVVFNWMLFFLDKVKHGNVLKAIILILMLWFYSALTGLSPSVLRAATMFSFIVVAKAFDRYTNIYNTLAASAFVLLSIDPFLIMEVGFQLSYIAVIGIVYIQPKIRSFYEPDNPIIDQVWSVTAVSIAAQITTFPLGLYYFHQFPNYFLLSNFIVIPVSTLIIYLGIGLFIFSKITFVASWLAIVFNWCVWLLNASVRMIEKWPHSLSQGISISLFETVLLYGIIVLCFYYFAKKKVNCLMGILGIVILLLSLQIREQQLQFLQEKIIIYNIPKSSAIDFISSREHVLLTDSTFSANESALSFHVKNNWYQLGLDSARVITGDFSSPELFIRKEIVQFREAKIVIIKDNGLKSVRSYHSTVPVDYVILSGNAGVRIHDVLRRYDPEKIIFDSSNSKYRIRKWKEECLTLSRSFYSVQDSGAFEAELSPI